MRTLTLQIAALSLFLLALHRNAEACGSYVPEPRVLRLSTHQLPSFDKNVAARSFAVFANAKAPAKLVWQQLVPMSYDLTQIANDMALANPVTLTLLGPSGTRVVSSKKHVFLARTFDFNEAANAIDIGNASGFSIALEGAHPDATWSTLEHVGYRKTNLDTWVTALGASPSQGGSIHLSRVKGTPFETVSLYVKDSVKMVTFLKHGDRNLGRFEGTPIGTFTNKGVTQLVLVDGARVSTAYLGDVRGGFGT
ncbi:MAG: hypothetical protein M4D80_41455 [Myxococcota bacterium]|nr:hypothetical protein [Deltaproteobacteria bacterium]MDQ3341663.1 hypothetical protein [Myxococcota bacterium]